MPRTPDKDTKGQQARWVREGWVVQCGGRRGFMFDRKWKLETLWSLQSVCTMAKSRLGPNCTSLHLGWDNVETEWQAHSHGWPHCSFSLNGFCIGQQGWKRFWFITKSSCLPFHSSYPLTYNSLWLNSTNVLNMWHFYYEIIFFEMLTQVWKFDVSCTLVEKVV